MQFEKSSESRSKSFSSDNNKQNRDNSIENNNKFITSNKLERERSVSKKTISNRSVSETSYLAKNKREKSQNSKTSNNDFNNESYLNKNNPQSNTNKRRSRNNSREGSKSEKSWKSQHRSPTKRKNLDFQVYIFDPFCTQLRSNGEAKFNEFRRSIEEAKIFFDDTLFIPDVDGSVLTIQHDDINQKAFICKSLFTFLKDNNLCQKKEKGMQNVLILVPNGLVSMVIGTKGKQIINLAKNTKTQIAVNQPVYKMLHRTISITGYPANIAEAVKNIYGIMEDRFYEVKQAEVESIPLDIYETTSTVSYFFLNINLFNYM